MSEKHWWNCLAVPRRRLVPVLVTVLCALAASPALTLAAPILEAKMGDGMAGSLNTLAGPVYEIMGSGSDVWGAADNCYFVYQQFNASQPLDMWAKVGLSGFVGGTDGWRKAGIMIRQDITPGSRGAQMLISEADANGVNTQIRKADGANSEGSANTGTRITYDTPAYLRLEYLGDGISFNSYYKKNVGDPWLRQDIPAFNKLTTAMSGTILGGLCVTAHNVGQQTTVQFGEVKGFVLASADQTLTWDEDTNEWGDLGAHDPNSHWLNGGVLTPEFPTIAGDVGDIAIVPGGAVSVRANRGAYSLTVNGGSVAVDSGYTLSLLTQVSSTVAGGIVLQGGTLATRDGSLVNLVTNGGGTVNSSGLVQASHLVMASGDTLFKNGLGALVFNQSAGPNVLDGTNTVRVNAGDLKMQALATSPLSGADLTLDGGTFTVTGAAAAPGTVGPNFLNASQFLNSTTNNDIDFNITAPATYNTATTGTFTGVSGVLARAVVDRRGTLRMPLSFQNNDAAGGFDDIFTRTAVEDNFAALFTGYFKPNQTGLWQFSLDVDDAGSMYIDLTGDGDFADANEEPRAPGGTATFNTASLTAGTTYRVAIGFREGGGTERIRASFQGPSGGGLQYINPSDWRQAGLWSGNAAIGPVDMSGTKVTVLSNSGLNAITDATASFGPLVIYDGATLTMSGSATTFTDISFFGDPGRTVGIANSSNVTIPIFDDGGVETHFVKRGTGYLSLPGITAAAASTFEVTAGTLVTQGPAPLGNAGNLLLGGGTFGVSGPSGAINMTGTDVTVTGSTTGSTIYPLTGTTLNFGDLSVGASAELTFTGGPITFQNSHLGLGSTLVAGAGSGANIGNATTNGSANVRGSTRIDAATYDDQGINGTMRIYESATFALDNTGGGKVVADHTLFRTEGTATFRAVGDLPLGPGDTRVQIAGGTFLVTPNGGSLSIPDTDISVVANGTLNANTGGSATFGRLSLGPTGILTTTGPAVGGMRFTDTTLAGTPAPTVAYVVPAGQVGNQVTTSSLGMEFNVASNVWLTQFGVFDSGSNGLSAPLNVRLYDRNNTTFPIASLNFTPSDPGTLVGGSRLKTLATPVMLPAGFLGTIVADGFNAVDLNGNNISPLPWTTNTGGGALSFVGSARWGTAGVYPGTADGGPANRYAAGTFQFEGAVNVAFNTLVPTYPGPLSNTGAAPALMVKQGPSDLILDQPGSGLQNTTLQVEAGRMIVKGAAPVTGATLNIRGANLMLVSGATDVVYPNAIRATANGTLIGASEGTGLATGSISLPDLKPTQGAVITMRDQIASCALILPNGVNAPTVVTPNALSHYGYHINNDGVACNLNNNAGMYALGKPASFQTFYGTSLLTSGPGGRGLDFNNDGDFLATGNIGQSDNYSNLFIGKITVTPATAGKWSFGIAAQDDPTGIWIDLNRNGIFESTDNSLNSDRGEELLWNASGAFRSLTLAAGDYMVAFTHREGGGGSQIEPRFWVEPTMGLTPTAVANMVAVKPSDPAQAGIWSAVTPGGGLDIVEGETRTLGSLTLASLTLSPGGVLNRASPDIAPGGRRLDRDITVTDALTMSKDLAFTHGDILTTTGATVTINPGATLWLNHPFDAATLNLQGNLVRTGLAPASRDVTITSALNLSSTLDMTDGGTLHSSAADITIGTAGKLTVATPLQGKNVTTTGTLNTPGAALTNLTITSGTTTLQGDTTLTDGLRGTGGTLVTRGDMTIDAQKAIYYTGQVRVESGNLNIFARSGVSTPTGVAAWYDANDINAGGAQPANGALISTWLDKSGRGRNLGGGGQYNSDPNLNTAGPNGKAVVTFDGDDWIRSAYNFDPLTNYSVLTVARYTGGDNERVISSTGRNWLFGFHGGLIDRWHAEGWIYPTGGTGGIAANTNWYLHAGTMGPATNNPAASFWSNGTLLTSNNYNSGDANYMIGQLELGAYNSTNETSKCEVAEVFIFDRVLSASELNDMGGYLAAKYGLTTGHTGSLLPKLGDVRLAGGSQLTVSGTGAAQTNSIGAIGGPTVTGPMIVDGAPNAPAYAHVMANAPADTLTFDAAVTAQRFDVTGPGTVALEHDVSVISGGALTVANNAALATQNSLTINAGTASVNVQGQLNVAPGTTLTLNVPVDGTLPSGRLYSLNAAAGITKDGANLVSLWADQSGAGNNFAQTTAASQPLFVAGALNGLPVVRFDGTDDRLVLGTASSPQTVFIVNRSTQFTAANGIWGSDNPADKGIRMTSATAWATPGDGNDFVNPGGLLYVNGVQTGNFGALGTPHILAAIRGTASPTTYNVTDLGGYYAARAFQGDIAEVLVFNRQLTTEEMNNVGGYLASKYGIASSYTGSLTPYLGNVTLGDLATDTPANLVLGGGTAAAFGSIKAADGASITGNVTLKGSVAPGASPGTLNVTGNFAMGAGSTYQWEAQLTDPGPPPVVSRDIIAVSGNLDISQNWNLALNPLNVVPSGSYDVMTYGSRTATVGTATPVRGTTAYADLINMGATSVTTGGTGAGAVSVNLAMIDTREWKNATTTQWDSGTNWTPNGAPDASIAAVVNGGLGGPVATVAAGTNAAAHTLIVDNAKALVELGGSLNVANNAWVEPTGQLTVNGTLKVGHLIGRPELRNGMVGLFRFDDTASLGKDTSGSGYNATNTGATYSAAGHSGGAASFAGSNEYLQLPSNTTLDNVQEGNYTIAAWVNADTVPPGTGDQNNAQYGIIEKAGWHSGLRYTGDTAPQKFAMDNWLTGNVGNGDDSTGTYAPGAWHQVVAVVARDLGKMTLYVDGAEQGSSTFTPGTLPIEYGATPWRLGIANPGSGTYRWAMDGLIDDAALWNRALDLDDIAALYAYGPEFLQVGGTLTTAGTTFFGPQATLDIPEIKVTGGTTTGGGTFGTPHTTLASGTTLRLAGGTIAGIFASNNTSTTAGSYAYEIESGVSNAVLIGSAASLRKSTAGAATLAGWEMQLANVNIEDGTTLITHGAKLTANSMNVSGGSLRMERTADLGRLAVGSTMTFTRDLKVAESLNGAGTLIADGNMTLDVSTALVNLGGTLRVSNTNPATSGNLLVNLGAGTAPPNGLVGYWALDEAAGIVASDSSGRSHPGTVAGTANWQPDGGRIGGAMRFNGATDIRLPYSTDFDLSTYSISAWVNVAQEQTNGGILGTRFGADNTFDLKVQATLIHGDVGTGSAWITGGGAVDITAAQGGDISLNAWHMITYVIDDATKQFRLYLDGGLANTIGYTGTPRLMTPAEMMRLGNSSGTEYLNNGRLDEVMVFNRALAQGDITALYNSTGSTPRLGNLRLDPSTQITLGGAGIAKFDTIGATGGPTITGNLTLKPTTTSSPANVMGGVQSLTLNATVDAPSFEVSGAGTVTLTDRLNMVVPGGKLVVPEGSRIASAGPNVLLDASNAAVQFKGGLKVESGKLTLNAPAPVAIPSGAIGRWTFDNAASLGRDSAGSYHGTLMGSPAPTQAAGMMGGAVDLERDNSNYIDLPDGFANFTGGISVAGWVKYESFTTYNRLIDFGNGAPSNNILLARVAQTSDLVWQFNGTAGGDETQTVAGVLPNGQWIHVAATVRDRDGNPATANDSDSIVYINGQQVAIKTDHTLPTNVTRINNYIGESNWSGDDFLDGLVDELLIYNRPLTATDVQTLYGAGLQGGYGPARFGNLDMNAGTQLVLGGSGKAGFISITAATGANIQANPSQGDLVVVDRRISVAGNFAVNANLQVSDGVVVEWDIVSGSTDIVSVMGNLYFDKSFTVQLFGRGGSIDTGDVLPVFLFDTEGNLFVGGSPYNGTANPLQYLLEVGNMEDPDNLYLWDLCDAKLVVLDGDEGWGIYLTGLQADLIPEPSTLALLALGALGLARRRRRRSA